MWQHCSLFIWLQLCISTIDLMRPKIQVLQNKKLKFFNGDFVYNKNI